jgi:hypothetical protein
MKTFQQTCCRLFMHHNLHAGETFQEGGGDLGDEIRCYRGNDTDRHRPGEKMLRIIGLTASGINLLQDAQCAAKKHLSVRRRLRLPLGSIEEPLPKLLFKFQDLLAERRLGNMALLGRTGKIPRP